VRIFYANLKITVKGFIWLLLVVSVFVGVFLAFTLFGVTNSDDLHATCRSDLDAMNTLLDPYDLPHHFLEEDTVPHPGDFSPNQFFSVFKHLRMQDGYLLDYVYQYGGFMGGPVVYARKIQDRPFSSYQEFIDVKSGEPNKEVYWGGEYADDYLSYVIRDETPASYLEYSLLDQYGNEFFAVGYANYKNIMLICDQSDIPTIEKNANEFTQRESFPKSIKLLKNLIYFKPSVRMIGNHVWVRYLLFTNRAGLVEVTYYYNNSDHSVIPERDGNILIYYDTGISD
jgi:hypothetical protein